MAISEQSGDASLAEALDVYSAYLRESQASPATHFGHVCGNHPHLAENLRKFHAVVQLAQAVANSRSFHQSLREHFGESAEVTVQLEEGFGAAPLASPSLEPTQVGTPPQAGRYALEDEVAHGGMGVIWRVRDRDLSRTLAMKVMTGAPGTSAATEATSRVNLARFLEEAQVTAQLDHPGIVPVHEVGFDAQGQPFFIMKLVKGRDLNEIFKLARVEQEGWNLPRAVGVVVKACQALAYAHTKGVIHRDLKPANIMVGRFGEVYVMDWGLAKITGRKDLHDIRPKEMQLTSVSVHSKRHDDATSTPDSPLITMDGSVVGTPAYMPPEQARGQVEEVDPLSDVYSLGAILYNLLTGQAPYVEAGARISPHTILGMVIQGPPKPVHQLNPESPPELIAICEKAMAREKRGRYQSSLDLAEDLQAFLDHRVVRAYRTGAVAEFKSWIARNKAAALAGAISIAVLLLFSALYSLRERSKAFDLKQTLTRQYLRRGQALCEQGDMARGLHWLARSLKEAPEQSTALKSVIRQNLASWAPRWNAPRAMLMHNSLVSAIALSPDGKRAVTGDPNGRVQFWSAETGEPLPLTLQHGGEINTIAFSPDGRRIATASSDQTARLWDSETGAALGPPMRHELKVWEVAFSPDGKRVLTRSLDSTARLWNGETAQPIGAAMRHDADAGAAVFSPDGQLVLTGSYDHTARLWNAENGQPVGKPMRHGQAVTAIAFSPDGRRILTGGEDKMARLWDVANGEAVGAPIRHGKAITAVAFSPDGRRILSASADTTVRFWDGKTGEPIDIILEHAQGVSGARFSADGKWVATACTDGNVRLWLADTGESLGAPMHHEDGLAGFFLQGRTVLTASGQAAGLWSVPLETSSRYGLQGPSGVTMAFSPDGKRAFVGGENGETWWWSAESGEVMRATVRQAKGFQIWAVALSSDGKRALVGGSDNTARLWSLEGEERMLASFVHEGVVRAVAFSPNGKLAATASFDATARLWSTDNGQQFGPSLRHSNLVEDVAFHPDGTLIATACGDGAARLWSVKTGRQVGPPLQHRGSVLAVTFSPDGQFVVTGGRDKTARFWHVSTGRPTGLTLEHPSWVEDICFSPDRHRLATICADGRVRLWSVETGESLGPPLLTNSGNGMEVAFSPDGTRIAAGGLWVPTRMWTLSPPFHGDLKNAEIWVQVLTWLEMDDNGVLSWLDRATWKARREQLEKLGGGPGRVALSDQR